MQCIVTAGPTYEELDSVRRLTNFSTGRLGIELANFLTARKHTVTLLVGGQSSYPGARRADRSEVFTTTADLRDRLQALSGQSVQAIFHAAAVSDFSFGKLWLRSSKGDLEEIRKGKVSTRQGTLLAELVPTPKIIRSLRDWFPKARIIGWKYGVDGKRPQVLEAAARQISECLTDACIANGPAYGVGFGFVPSAGKPEHLADLAALFDTLARFVEQ